MLNIYGHFLSMPSNKVRLCASYLELPHEYHHVDLQAGQQQTPKFLKINPAGRVPAIEDNGFTLSQSDAINRYLCALSGPRRFYPDDINKQAEINQWNDYATQHILSAMGRILFNRVFTKMIGETADERSIAFGERVLARDLPHFDHQFESNSYLCGEHVTLADISFVAALEPSEMAGIDLSIYPNITQWRKTMMAHGFYRHVHTHFAAEMSEK